MRTSDTIRWWVGFVCAVGWLAISIKTALLLPYLLFCAITAALIITRDFATTRGFKQRVTEVKMLQVGLRNWHWRDLWFILTGRT